MEKPLLTVCLITYNQASYVQEAIESVLMQQVKFSWELVIADDCSTDGTREIILEYKNKYPKQIKLILQKKNVGPEKNWLELMSYPQSKYIAYLEGDDFWTDPNKLQRQVDFMENNSEYALVFHPTKVFFENGDGKETLWPAITTKSKLTTNELLKENFIPSNAVVYRRQSYDKYPLGVMPGDWYMHLFHAQYGKIGFINEVMSVYRRHEGSLWWGSDQEMSKHWQTYGIQHIAMFLELIKIYGHDKKLYAIICSSLQNALEILLKVDKEIAVKAITSIYKESPAILASVMINQNRENEQLAASLADYKEKTEEINQEVLTLRNDLFHVRDELRTLKNSRLLGKIIKARNLAGSARQVPKQAMHQVRVVGAPFVPAPVRRNIKAIYGKSRKPRVNSKEVQVFNEPWSNSLPLVSVVIPYYNRADTIDDTLHSLEQQTFTNYETLLVDDGSTDTASIEKLSNLKENVSRIAIIHQENQGVAAARNNGISHAKGKYIVCLDSDDMLDPTYLEKAVTLLETQPDVAIATSWMDMFGVKKERFKNITYDPLQLYKNNMVITAGMFRKEAWETAGGYKSKIGYEDWDFWLTLSENGFWGRLIPEALFRYRVAMQSRYVEDKDVHWNNLQSIRALHPKYKATVRRLIAKRQAVKHVVDAATALVNISNTESFRVVENNKSNVLITIPWMTFGGAETLIYNYCREVKHDLNITFMTGLPSEHEWEYKFKEITPNVYHLANLFDDQELHLEFIANYIKTRKIDLLHIIHNGFTFKMLPELKKRFPELKVAVTMFNDRVEYFEQSIRYKEHIDGYVSDNEKVANNYHKQIGSSAQVTVVPNGINCYDEFSPNLFYRAKEREALGLLDDDLAVFFVGRLSEEKNPDVFLQVAEKMLANGKNANIKFLVIGDGPMREEVESMIKKSANANIHYLGYQSEVARYFSAADIFVLPSSIEGFPLSILEAMAMRVAVVASDVGAVAEVVESGKEGFVVKAGDANEIADAITKLSADSKKLDAMKNSARQKVEERYSNRILGANYKKLYKDLVK